MVTGRMFGHYNQNAYSPAEYAMTFGPVLESHMRNSSRLKSANMHLEPHNTGVSLRLVLERNCAVAAKPVGTPPNKVLHEHGNTVDFDRELASVFKLCERLTDITVIDARGNYHTFKRESLKAQTDSLNESGELDLSPLQG